MSPRTRSRPDAEIVTIINKPIELIELKERPFHSFTRYNGEDVDVSLIVDQLTRLASLRRCIRSNIDFIIEKERSLINRKYRRLKEKFDPALISIMLDGHNRIHALLDTPGGNMAISDMYISATTEIGNRGGSVETWGGFDVSSAGAKIFEAGTRRYGLTNSSFLWHLSNMPNMDEEDDTDHDRALSADFKAEDEAAEMRHIKSFFQTHCNPQDFPAVLARINQAEADIENPLNDITFTGQELKSYGILHRVFPISNSMRKIFSQRVGEENIPSQAKEFFDELSVKEFFRKLFKRIPFEL